MKKMIVFLILMFTSSAYAAGNGGTAFQIYSGASGKVTTTSAFDVRKFGTKTLSVSGVTNASTEPSKVFKNMSGTVVVQCAPTSSGPWATCIANDYAQTAVSKTANGVSTWKDSSAYVRLVWTASTVKTKLKAFLNWIEL